MFARIFMCVSRGKRKSELDGERKSKRLQDLMTECSTNMIVIARCLSLSGKGNLTGIITIHPPSAEGRRTAHTSKLISLSSFSAFLSQDKHMPEYDLLPCLSGCDTYSPLSSFLFSAGCLFVHLVEVYFL